MASRFTSREIIIRTRAHASKSILFAFTTFTNSRVTHRITKKYEGNRNGILVFFGEKHTQIDDLRPLKEEKYSMKQLGIQKNIGDILENVRVFRTNDGLFPKKGGRVLQNR